MRFPARPGGPRFGTPGPDKGYALHLARRLEEELRLAAGESAEDVVVGSAVLAGRRAALLGRAPVADDIRTALALWGWLTDEAPEGLVALRRTVFSALAHDDAAQRALTDRVPERALLMSADQVAVRVSAGEWADLVGAAGGPDHPDGGD